MSTGVQSPVTTQVHRQPLSVSIWTTTTSPTGRTAEIFLLLCSPVAAAAPVPASNMDQDPEKTGVQLRGSTLVWSATPRKPYLPQSSPTPMIKMWKPLCQVKPESPSTSHWICPSGQSLSHLNQPCLLLHWCSSLAFLVMGSRPQLAAG